MSFHGWDDNLARLNVLRVTVILVMTGSRHSTIEQDMKRHINRGTSASFSTACSWQALANEKLASLGWSRHSLNAESSDRVTNRLPCSLNPFEKLIISSSSQESPWNFMKIESCFLYIHTVTPRLTKIIRSGITFVSRNLRYPKRDFP